MATQTYFVGNLNFMTQALNQRSMQYYCCYSQYHESQLTWTPIAHREGVYLGHFPEKGRKTAKTYTPCWAVHNKQRRQSNCKKVFVLLVKLMGKPVLGPNSHCLGAIA